MTQNDDIKKRLETLEDKESAREKREVISEWLRTKCIWVWTILMGWCFYAGVFIVNHYDKASIAIVAAFKALNESGK